MKTQNNQQNQTNMVNGFDTQPVKDLIGRVANSSDAGQTSWKVTTSWKGGVRTETHVRISDWRAYVKKLFTIATDEPLELGGTNTHANPQETLLAALNACMTVGYAVGCAMEESSWRNSALKPKET